MSHIDIDNFPHNWKNTDISTFNNFSENFLKLLAKFIIDNDSNDDDRDNYEFVRMIRSVWSGTA